MATDPGEVFRVADQEYDPAIAVADLAEHPRNVNEGDVGAIHMSMADHGYVGGIIVQRSTGHVIAGNHTFRTAVQQGARHIPGFWLDVTDDEAERLMLDLNHSARLGRDDPGLLFLLLQDMASRSSGLPATYDGDDLDALKQDLDGGGPPGDFPEFGSDINTEHKCPSCGYTWSGKAGAKEAEKL